MDIKVTKNNGELTVALTGRLDTLTSPELEEILEEEIDDAQKLILDLSAVKYISSAGIRVLLGAYRAMEEKDGVLLRRPSDKVMEVLDLTGLTDAFEIEQYDNDE